VRVDPELIGQNLYGFRFVAAPAGRVVLSSRSAVPAHLGLNQDHRRLGVPVTRIELRLRQANFVFRPDSFVFNQPGCYGPENGFNWTNGEMELPAGLFANLHSVFGLVVEIAENGMRYPLSLLPPRSPEVLGVKADLTDLAPSAPSRPNADPTEIHRPPIFDALRLLTPYDLDLPKSRIGAKSDGGYVIFTDEKFNGPLYSFGITNANKMSFEVEIARLGRQVFMFDHNVPLPWKIHPNLNFCEEYLSTVDDPSKGEYTLGRYLDRLGHVARHDMFLKLDMEGSEWDILPHLSSAILCHFSQIILELHWLSRLSDYAYCRKLILGLTSLNECFSLGHVHANNFAPVSIVSGFVCPEVLELTYVRSDLCTRTTVSSLFPTSLDYANRSDVPDHLLWFFPFLSTSAQLDPTAFSSSFAWSRRAL